MGMPLHGLFYGLIVFGFLNTGSLAKIPELTISPSPSVQTKPVGRSVLLTCQPDVENKGLISDLAWKDPQNRTIDANYIDRQWVTTEVMEEKALALIINSFQESQAGDYTCTASYANTNRLSKTVRLESIHPIKFEDAPEVQNPIYGRDYKIRCKVSANPAPHVDWSKNNDLIKPSGRYIIEPDGLLISKVTDNDDGIYICRAVVIKTGELSARSIKVEVHTKPDFNPMNNTVELIEGETQSVECSAHGKPKPTYSWIRKDDSKNVVEKPRFTVNKATGMMIISPVQEEDHGEYKCVASNAAANAEKIIKLNVKVKPKISEIKNITVPIHRVAELECLARGRPLPEISFRKYGSPDRMTQGSQLYDKTIFVQNRRGANDNEIIGVLRIQGARRSDDGLYECMASNSAGDSFKTGHITVEFPPSFENTPMNETYSWDQKSVNLTCLAESIPNATIRWRKDDYDIERDFQFVKKYGNGPVSTLTVTPVAQKYYGFYKCVANNPHGEVNHTIHLKEAFRPSSPIQTDVDTITATTIKFRIIGPQMDGNSPVRSYIVQYRDSRTEWMYALNKTWTINFPYVLENLQPSNTYHFRFAAINDVGMGLWSSEKTQTMPRISSPAAPEILNQRTNGYDYIESQFDTRIEVKWKIPVDNGERIDMYQITYCEVVRRLDTYDEVQCFTPIDLDVTTYRKTSYVIKYLQPDKFYKVNVAAHNRLGFSRPGETIFRTARGIDKDHLVATSQGLVLSSAAIVGIVVASLLVILLIIDVSCFFVNRAGVFYLMCGRKRKSPPDEINKLASLTGWRFPLPYCSHTTTTSYTGSGAKHSGIDLEILPPPDSDLALYEEKEPLKENGRAKIEVMDDRLKKDTRILYDDKSSTVKTFIGKDSAV